MTIDATRVSLDWKRFIRSLKWGVGNEDDARDIAQEAFLRALEKGDTSSSRIYNNARNERKRLLRRRRKFCGDRALEHIAAPDPAEHQAVEYWEQTICDHVERLDPSAQALLRQLAQGKSQKQIAREMGLNADAVRKRTERLRKDLRTWYALSVLALLLLGTLIGARLERDLSTRASGPEFLANPDASKAELDREPNPFSASSMSSQISLNFPGTSIAPGDDRYITFNWGSDLQETYRAWLSVSDTDSIDHLFHGRSHDADVDRMIVLFHSTVPLADANFSHIRLKFAWQMASQRPPPGWDLLDPAVLQAAGCVSWDDAASCEECCAPQQDELAWSKIKTILQRVAARMLTAAGIPVGPATPPCVAIWPIPAVRSGEDGDR